MKDIFVLHSQHYAPETIDEIVKEAQKIPVAPAKVGNANAVDEKVRRADLRWIEKENEDFEPVFKNLEKLFHNANRDSFGFDIQHLPSIQFTEYPAAVEGHYDWHVDVFWQTQSFYQRKLSMVVQLSDPSEYEGGQLEIDEWQRPDPELLKQKGSIIIFPSFVKHRVTPVTKGLRRSMVAWIEGPTWR